MLFFAILGIRLLATVGKCLLLVKTEMDFLDRRNNLLRYWLILEIFGRKALEVDYLNDITAIHSYMSRGESEKGLNASLLIYT